MPQIFSHVSAILLGAVFVIATSLPASGMSEQEATKTLNFKPFGKLVICLPLNILIIPSQQDADGLSQYYLKLEGEPSVLSGFEGSVKNETLHLGSEASFKIRTDVKLTVALPYYALKGIFLEGASEIYIAPGFQSQSVDLTVLALGGAISASQLTVKQLNLKANGLATLRVNGEVEVANIEAHGGSSVYLSGLKRQAEVALTGLPSVNIVSTSPDVVIKGSSQGSKITYNQGSCSVKGDFSGGAACVQEAGLWLTIEPMKWTCRASLGGNHMCATSGGGTSTSSFSSVGSSCQTMSWNQDSTCDSCERVFATGAHENPTHTARKLRQSSVTSSSSTSSGTSGGSTSAGSGSTFTYISNTPGSAGTQQTVCSFVNNVGGCQVNGTPVPVRQFNTPTPSPTQDEELLSAINTAASSNSVSTASGSISAGGTVCTFVNGIGGCSGG